LGVVKVDVYHRTIAASPTIIVRHFPVSGLSEAVIFLKGDFMDAEIEGFESDTVRPLWQGRRSIRLGRGGLDPITGTWNEREGHASGWIMEWIGLGFAGNRLEIRPLLKAQLLPLSEIGDCAVVIQGGNDLGLPPARQVSRAG
jgi:hypothetical protein